MEKLPKKWCVKLDEDNIDHLNSFLKLNSSFYSEYEPSWGFERREISSGYYFYFPETSSQTFASCSKNIGYELISTQEFIDYAMNKKQIININNDYEIITAEQFIRDNTNELIQNYEIY